MPREDDGERETGPLGSEVSDPATEGDQAAGDQAAGGPASGVAGPSYPPEETEPDATDTGK